MNKPLFSAIGLVVIGRNEGERLHVCLQSIVGQVAHIVYVDSGSTDKSVSFARSLGIDVIELDMSRPFTAARARNTGFQRLEKLMPQLEVVQFIDGDCEVVDGWLWSGLETLRKQLDVAVVCGRVRERFREASLYNQLVDDLDWDSPPGEVNACGGNAMMRADAFRQVGLFDPSLIAGEEPELCVRFRREDWKILRISVEMVLHDAALLSFGQWWKRTIRSGHSYAEGMYLHGRTPQRHFVQQTRRAVFWAALIPLLTIILAPITGGWSLLLLAAYPLQWLRVAINQHRMGRNIMDASVYSLFLLLAKFAELSGMLVFWSNLLRGKKTRLMEYQ